MNKILIVDDAAFMRMVLRNILLKAGYQTVEAANGHEAIASYQAEKPDLVTMDMTMPVLDGISAAGRIRALDPNARIIMCSAMGQQSMVMKSIEAGAVDFIVKPFQPERVLSAIAHALGARASHGPAGPKS